MGDEDLAGIISSEQSIKIMDKKIPKIIVKYEKINSKKFPNNRKIFLK